MAKCIGSVFYQQQPCLKCSLHVMCAGPVLESGSAVAYDLLNLPEALFLHVREHRHVEDEPLDEGGHRVRSRQQHRR